MSDDEFDVEDNVLISAVENADRYIDATKPQPKHLECLQTNFGHNVFRPKQWDIIRSLIEDKRDNCVIMPTGYGKSLCFQFPAVYTNGITLVVSPLISLMQDQLLSLNLSNIPACLLGSAQKKYGIEGDVIDGAFRLVYASPEYLSGSNGKDLLKRLENKLTLIAIDEAHCVSQWGHDFRPDYRKLGEIRAIIPKVPILAVTATATSHVREDIAKMLHMRNPQFVCMGFDRPNIEFSFLPKSKNVWDDLRSYTTNIVGHRGSVIIYVLRRSDAEEIAKILQDHNVQCDYYHAGVSLKKRNEVLESFMRDRLKVIVATVAFGMGIDKRDVQYVIHYGASKNLETYYQEVGRAGRDGSPSKAITYFDKKDFSLHEWLLKENNEHKSAAVIKHLTDLAQQMKEFCYTTGCRRAFILDYFGSSSSHLRPHKKCCDNCACGQSIVKLSDKYENIDNEGRHDFTENANLFLQTMAMTSKAAVAISVLKGSSIKTAMGFKHTKFYGAGRLMQKDYWDVLKLQLQNEGFLELKQNPAPYAPTQLISTQGYNWLKSSPQKRLLLKPIPEMYAFLRQKRKIVMNNNLSATGTTGEHIQTNKIIPTKRDNREIIEMENVFDTEKLMSDKDLEDILLSIRAALAENSDCVPFLVASNIAIKEMVQKKPVSIREFKAASIDGYSMAKIDKFATIFISGIVKFMNNDFYMENILKKFPMKMPKSVCPITVQQKIKELIAANKSMNDIVNAICLTPNKITIEIVILMRSGHNITKTHLSHLVGAHHDLFNKIKDRVAVTGFQSLDNLNRIKENFTDIDGITEHMLALVLNYLKVRHYFGLLDIPYFEREECELINAKVLLGKNIIQHSDTELSSGLKNETLVSISNESQNYQMASTSNFVNRKEEPANEIEDSIQFSQYIGDEPIDDIFDKWEDNQSDTKENNELHAVTKTSDSSIPILKSSKLNKPKRATAKSVSRIVYCSDSESDDEQHKEPTKRAIPQWMSKAKGNTNNKNESSNSNVKRARF